MRIIIPNKKREEILKLIHDGHLGLNKCKIRAKETVCWPGINEQLEQLMLNCQLCLKYSRSKDKNMPHTALGHEIPSVPWSKVTTDIFHFELKLYLLVVDYTSRFPIVREIRSMSAQHIAEHFKLIFSEYGWPASLISDNGPCYVAEIFTSLMKEYSVNHITSSPHYPQSNGQAEKFVQIVKNIFYKAKDEGTDIHKCLMIYHNTPLASTSKLPMQMLQQRSEDHNYQCWKQHEDNLELPLNKHQQAKTNTYLHTIYTLDKRLCVKTLTL